MAVAPTGASLSGCTSPLPGATARWLSVQAAVLAAPPFTDTWGANARRNLFLRYMRCLDCSTAPTSTIASPATANAAASPPPSASRTVGSPRNFLAASSCVQKCSPSAYRDSQKQAALELAAQVEVNWHCGHSAYIVVGRTCNADCRLRRVTIHAVSLHTQGTAHLQEAPHPHVLRLQVHGVVSARHLYAALSHGSCL